MTEQIPFHRTREANRFYTCRDCGARHVKLWRDLLHFRCALCLQAKKGPITITAEGKALGEFGTWTDQVHGYLPAVPCEGYTEPTCWGYGSVPPDGVRWWKALPLALTHDLLLVDCETTGLDPRKDEVISVAWMLVDRFGHPMGVPEQLLFLPAVDPPPEVAELNGYSREKWLCAGAAPITPQALFPLQEAAQGRYWGGSNPAFDWEMLKHNGKLPFFLQSHHMVDVPSMFWSDVLAGVIPNIRQGTLTKHFLRREQRHSAREDIIDLCELYRIKAPLRPGEPPQ